MLVNNIEELRSAIEDNETEIVLAESGDFVDESTKIDESQKVSLVGKNEITIRSENPNDFQTLAGLNIENSENIQIENVKVTGLDIVKKERKGAATLLLNSNNINLSNVSFEGKKDFESLDVRGLLVIDSSDVTVENSQFSDFRKGLLVKGNSADIEIIGNEFVSMIEDAILIGGNPKNSVTIENNVIRDHNSEKFNLIDDPHGDAIQFYVKSSRDRDVSIKNNVALMGDGARFQGIFIETNGSGSLDNFDIENNLIHTNAQNGISIDKGGKNVNIKGNTVVFRDSEATENKTKTTRIFVGGDTEAVVENNIASFFRYDGERFGGTVSAKEPTNGNISTNFKSLAFGPDLPYEEVFKNGDMLTDPEFYSQISPEDFAVLSSISAGANLEQLPETMAGAPIDGVSEGTGNPEPSPDPITPESNILISFSNANANNDVLGTAEADIMEADADSSGLRGLGRDGNDTLIGANNVDLSGENGDDLLILNGGDSLIRGGAGSDTFKITSETESGSNILDFEQGVDTIEFRDIQGVSSFSDLDITPQNLNFTANSFINFGDEQIKVKGVMVEDFTSGDFDFS